MIGWFHHFRQRWNDWCGDREMELEIRKHLTSNGYYGATAKFRAVRLIAVQRPGWLQIYRFEATARLVSDNDDPSPGQPAQYHELYGLVRDDIRHKISHVRVFESSAERQSLFARWSDGLICLRGAHGLGVEVK